MFTKKINLGSTLAALILFFVPWLDIQCSGKSLATQSGVQTILGKGTASEFQHSLDKPGKKTTINEGESLGYSIFAGIAFVAVLAAFVLSMAAIWGGGVRVAPNLVEILCAAALGLLVLQAVAGFPVKAKMESELRSETGTSDETDLLEESMSEAINAAFSVNLLAAFYLELVALGIPTILLANRLIDRASRPVVGDSAV